MSVNASKANYTMLGNSHITTKYIDVNECYNDDIYKYRVSQKKKNKTKQNKKKPQLDGGGGYNLRTRKSLKKLMPIST